MFQQQDLKKELKLWQRRLHKRREQKAIFGSSADPSIDIEIEDIEERIKRLQAQLAEQKQNLKKELDLWQRRLKQIKERQAKDGINTPDQVLFGIEAIETKIESLQVQLAEQKQTWVSSTAKKPQAASLLTFEVTDPDPELASLRAKPRIFLCHASEDKPRVKELYHLLKEAGYRPWLDKFDLLPGQRWRSAIKKVITNYDNLILVCLSQHSITKRGVIQQEIKWALDILAQIPEEAIYLIPVRLEVCQLPKQLEELHWVNLYESDSFEYLTRALDSEIGKSLPTPETSSLKTPKTEQTSLKSPELESPPRQVNKSTTQPKKPPPHQPQQQKSSIVKKSQIIRTEDLLPAPFAWITAPDRKSSTVRPKIGITSAGS